MTTPWRDRLACWQCGAENSTEPPMDRWIRLHPDLDSVKDCVVICDGDKWVHKYGTRRDRRGVDRDVQYLQQIEIKTNAKDIDLSQRDTLRIVGQILRSLPFKEHRDDGQFQPGHAQNARQFKLYSEVARRHVQVICYGVHLLQLSGNTPDDSETIAWDRTPISVDQLVGLLRFDLNPNTLRPIEPRQRKRRIHLPTLFTDWPKSTQPGAWDAETDPRTDLFPEFEDGD